MDCHVLNKPNNLKLSGKHSRVLGNAAVSAEDFRVMKCTSNCSPALMKMVCRYIQFQFIDTPKTVSRFPFFSKSRADSVEQMRVELVESGVRFHSEKGSPGDLGARICCTHRLLL